MLTPPLPHGTKRKAFLEQYGHKIATGQGKVYRERGWGMSGRDALASHATPLEGWVSKGQTPDVKCVSVLTGALQNTAAHDPPLFVMIPRQRPNSSGKVPKWVSWAFTHLAPMYMPPMGHLRVDTWERGSTSSGPERRSVAGWVEAGNLALHCGWKPGLAI